jgi:hypothetical protein
VNGEGDRVLAHAAALRKAGAAVEIRELARSAAESSRGDNNSTYLVEELTTESTLMSFLQEEALREGLSNETLEALVTVGLDILESVESGGGHESIYRETANSAVALEEVTVEGFGPFQERVAYPLANRGLVLLRGVNRDGGSDR